ncbi:MAG: cysteine peptidase family C39 domain-containing protein [Planctomycetota bacterium]|jgi:hypothetical protein
MTVLSVLLGAGACLGSRRLKKALRLPVCIAAAAVLLAFHVFVTDSVVLANLLPLRDVLVFGQWLPPLTGIFLGLALPAIPRPWWRRAIPVVLCTGIVAFVCYEPVFTSPPRVRDFRIGGHVVQTSPYTCGAAATANLLLQNGIETAESEMVDLCKSRRRGTYLHGMVRGLRIRTAGTPWKVEAAAAGLDDLKRTLSPPLLLLVELTEEVAEREPRYYQEWGWIVGRTHVVVFLGFDGEKVRIVEPSFGFEHWDMQALRDLWDGRAVYLVRR